MVDNIAELICADGAVAADRRLISQAVPARISAAFHRQVCSWGRHLQRCVGLVLTAAAHD